MITNTAKSVIKPTVPKILRAVFIYTGQGDTTLLVIPNGDGADDYLYVLVDCDLDKEKNEVNLIAMLTDLLGNKPIDIFINTHPHSDHIGGIKELYDKVKFTAVWHSNHRPTSTHGDSFKEMKKVLDAVGKANEFHLKGSNDLNKIRDYDGNEVTQTIGYADYQVFAPAEYVCDDIEEETPQQQYGRIHEQCAVFKIIYGGSSILFTGDAEKAAWEDHIAEYHEERLKSDIMTASHHGSYTAFMKTKEDDSPYTEHLDHIDATHLVISAPKQKDSPFGHPHDEALEIYRQYFDIDKIHHLGEGPYCLVVDIDNTGHISVKKDESLIKAYCKKAVEEGNNGKESNKPLQNSRNELLAAYATQARPFRQ